MPNKPKPNRKPRLSEAGERRLKTEIFTQATKKRQLAYSQTTSIRSLGMALVAPIAAPAMLAVPVAETKELEDFPYPVIDEGGIMIDMQIIDVTVLSWVTHQHSIRWHFLYREAGSTVWKKPPFVSENAPLGMAAIVLPTGSYEFLPLPGVNV